MLTNPLQFYNASMKYQESFFNLFVSQLAEAPLSGITTHTGKPAGYGESDNVVRYASEKDPIYTAIHVVDGQEDASRQYSPLHTHPFPELNILAAPPGRLRYKIGLGDETQEVVSPAVILIPPGLPHSANFFSGKGEFVVVRLMPEQLANNATLFQRFKKNRQA